MKELLKNIIPDQQQLTWSEQYIRRDFPDERLVNFTAMSWSGTILPMNTKFLCSSTTLQETFPGSYPITA